MGIISAIGTGVDDTLQSLRAGRSGIGPVCHLITSHTEFPVGEVKLSNDDMETLLGIPTGEPTTRTALMGTIALNEALAMASLDDAALARGRAAFLSGTTVGGMDRSEVYYPDFISNDKHKEFILTHDCGACSEMIAASHPGFRYISTLSTACSSAANSIIAAAGLLLTEQTEIAVAGGSECLTKFHLNGFNTLMILDRERCRPFDRDRAGINLGEGAAYIVMERLSHALARGVKPLAILAGWGNACDAFHQTASSPDGVGAYLAMKKALDRAEIEPSMIGYINAHGTGTPNNDMSESRAMQRLFVTVPPVSSTKSSTGHTTSASGAIESVVTLLAILHRFYPANVGFSFPMEEGIVPVTNPGECIGSLDYALCNSFGFGGNDSSLIFKRYDS